MKNLTSIANIVFAQKNFFATNQTKNIDFRLNNLKLLKKTIETNESKILDALYNDLRKPYFEAYASEIGPVLTELNSAIKNIYSWNKDQKVSTGLINFPSKSYISRMPYGVVLIISPWNYPINLNLIPLISSIAAGNCTIIKPSEFAPSTSNLIAQLISSCFNEEYIAVIEGDSAIAKELLEQKFDYIFFTGSKSVGKIVMNAAAKNLTPLTLELGGKNPCIVDEKINLEITAKRIAWGKFFNAGQTCTAPDFVLVNKKIKSKLLEKMKFYFDKFIKNTTSEYSKIINLKHFERLLKLVENKKIEYGEQPNISLLTIPPTIIDEVDATDTIMQDEIFGPILPIIEYENEEYIKKILAQFSDPLVIYIFSECKNLIEFVIQNSRSGTVCINDVLIQNSTTKLPFGGVGSSGFGRYHGKVGFDSFTYVCSIMKKSFHFDLSLRYPPYSNKKISFLKKIYYWFSK